MTARRQLWVWVCAAIAAVMFLIGMLLWERSRLEDRWNTFLQGDPKIGASTFQAKGCIDCHALCGTGTREFPDLGLQRTGEVNMNQLAIQMWNHMPAMAKKWQDRGKDFPRIGHEEMSNLFAYLYSACYVLELGNAEKGRRLFGKKGCIQCHSMDESTGKVGPNLRTIGAIVTPIYWSQSMWNHAPAMEAHMREMKIPWPRFEKTEMNDLLTYLQTERAGPQREFDLLPANAEHGWELFQKKGCIACHRVKGQGGTVGPDLSFARTMPRTITEMAGQMWNHSPEMWVRMKEEGIARPTFEGQEMSDLIAFLYSLRSFELGGSPIIGRDLFNQRKCGQCHGAEGEGTQDGPVLRKRGQILTPVNLAQRFWEHGPTMIEKSRQHGYEWTTLQENDLEHLLAFLNSPRKTQ